MMRVEVPAGPAINPSLGRVVLVAVFWLGLAVAVVPWWQDTPAGSVAGVAPTLTEVGRLAGIVGGYLLLAQFVLMSRISRLERWAGGNLVLRWHRDVGASLVVMVVMHVVFILLGYANANQASLPTQTWRIVTTYEAVVATAILLALVLLAARAVRRVLPYEVWYLVHMSSYLVLLLIYGHQFADGEQFLPAGFGRRYWTFLYVVVVASLVYGRVVAPFRLNRRHRLRVREVVVESDDVFSIYITGRRLKELQVKAGHYFRWRFLARGCWWQAHPFSLSASPNGRWLRLTVKVVGDYTAKLSMLPVGVRVYVAGPSGVFTSDRASRPRALLIAGGSGIAPVRALLEELPRGAIVIYRARSGEDLVFREELEVLAEARGAEVWFVVGPRDDPDSRYALTPRGLRELVPDVAYREVYVCGPSGLTSAVVDTLRRLRVPERQIHLDRFEL